MGKYYYVGATKTEAKALSLPKGGSTIEVFDDIADIDLITTEFKRSKIREELKKVNPNLTSKDSLFIAQYPYKTDAKLYYGIQDEEEFGSGYITGLRKFAEERSIKFHSKEKLALDIDDNFREYCERILDDILSSLMNDRAVSSYLLDVNSLLMKQIKDKLVDLENCHSYQSRVPQYRKIEERLREYKNLRYLVLEYLAYKNKRDMLLKKHLLGMSKSVENGSIIAKDYIIDAIKDAGGYHQMTLDEITKKL